MRFQARIFGQVCAVARMCTFVTVEEAALCIARSQEGQAAAAAAAERELQRVQAEEAAA